MKENNKTIQKAINVIDKNGKQLMPTFRFGKVRHMLKNGQAVIVKHEPFTIQLTYDTTNYVQEIEMCIDTGYFHIGTSIKSKKYEYVSNQYDTLKDEKQRHDDCRKYRKKRRSKFRYRKSKFKNRKKEKGWIAPSIQHKYEIHLFIINKYINVIPIKKIVIETGQFNIRVLDAIENNIPIPQDEDYQYGERYGIETLREAVFMRDNHKCQICGKGINEGKILHVHHALFWEGRHSNRMCELLTVCTDCHTTSNHQPNGKLWGIVPKNSSNYTGATFMNIVRKKLYFTLKEKYQNIDIKETYGSLTKCSRYNLNLEKSHVNDAYAMGQFHPEIRAKSEYFEKRRRNNRILEKLYDAKIIDTRTGKKVSGKDLGCERTNRKESRNSEKNLRIYRGQKINKGRRAIRRKRYEFQPGTLILINNKKRIVLGCHKNGNYIEIIPKGNEQKNFSIKKCKILVHSSGWKKIISPYNSKKERKI